MCTFWDDVDAETLFSKQIIPVVLEIYADTHTVVALADLHNIEEWIVDFGVGYAIWVIIILLLLN